MMFVATVVFATAAGFFLHSIPLAFMIGAAMIIIALIIEQVIDAIIEIKTND